MADVTHGTVGGYTNHYCRCDDCKGAMMAVKRAWWHRQRKQRVFVDIGPPAPNWWLRAACRGADTELFFSQNPRQQRAALAYCTRCPVTADCLAAALHEEANGAYGRYGVRGGLPARTRAGMVPR